MRSFVVLAAILAASPALAQQAAPAPAASPAAAAPKEKPICRSIEVTGSTLPKRECHSRAQWQAIDAANNGGVQGRPRVGQGN